MTLADVASYFDHVQRKWEGYGCEAREIPGQPIFEYELDRGGRRTGRGHLLVELTFPGYDGSYLDADDWLEPHSGHIRRATYAYDLIHLQARLECWHWHEGTYHKHDGRERRPIARVTLEDVIDASYRILESAAPPRLS
jgi:hypothetical protein